MNINFSKKQLAIASFALLVCFGIGLKIYSDGNDDAVKEDSRWKPNTDASYVTDGSANDVRSVVSHQKNEIEEREERERIEDKLLDEPAVGGLSRTFADNLEMPAEIVASSMSETILCKTAFTISYNSRTRCPNYVAWHLTSERVNGNVERLDKFLPDPAIGATAQVTTQDYSNSGYDRGHICPAADNKHDEKAMMESFFMTNICPQSHNLNAGDWKELEEQCRQWVIDYSDLYIAAGPIFDSKKPKTIGNRKNVKIAVPDRFFKVILMMKPTPKAIGFIYPNDKTNKEMRSYSLSVDEVERITGLDFFCNLPDDVERKVERAHNPAEWGI